MKAVQRAAVVILVVVYVAALGAGPLAPHDYATQFRQSPDAPPSREFLLGTDELGRDLFSRLLYGSRVSLLLAPAAALLSTAVAALVAGLAGYLGKTMGGLVMRITDLIMSLPWLFLLLTVRALLPLNTPPLESVLITFLLLGLLGWAPPARVLGAGMRSLCSRDFVLHARGFGCTEPRLFFRQILPNLKPILAAQFWVSIPVFILSEANLGLLGLGVGEPLPSWGNLLRNLENHEKVLANPWLAAPLLLLIVVVGCFHFAIGLADYSK